MIYLQQDIMLKWLNNILLTHLENYKAGWDNFQGKFLSIVSYLKAYFFRRTCGPQDSQNLKKTYQVLHEY